mmetsp:Transcript_14140/g.26595  ORF Transcript_14140/g.26595 Transcript_14140/m.26595 type:complete len:244 (-) Transcript_14140:4240-4971(-)
MIHFRSRRLLAWRCFFSLTEGAGLQEKIFVTDSKGVKVSPWHDLELHRDGGVFQAVIEIPIATALKYEVSKRELFNPIMPDSRVSKTTGQKEIRHYALASLSNYGMLPRTWENDRENDGFYPYKGDGDPLDILELSPTPLKTGQVLDVKVIGAMCLIDQGEADWKLLCIDIQSPLAAQLSSPADVEKVFPGRLKALQTWYEEIKTYDGKPRNRFEGGVEDSSKALKVIETAHKHWEHLEKARS